MRNHLGIEVESNQNGQNKQGGKLKIKTRDQTIRKCDTCGKKFIRDRKPVEDRNRNRCPSCIAKVDGIYRSNTTHRGIEIR